MKKLLFLTMIITATIYQLGINEEIWIWVLVAGFILEFIDEK